MLSQTKEGRNGSGRDSSIRQGLDFISDEVLCENAQRGCEASAYLLWQRYQDFVRKVIYRENQRHRLPPGELPDALQDAYFAFHAAVQRYDRFRESTASFKTFLSVAAAHRFSNYCSLWRIYHLHLASGLEGNEFPNGSAEAEEAATCSWPRFEEQNFSDMNWKNFLATVLSSDHLADVLHRLRQKEKRLIATWLQYGHDREVARIFGISPPAAKLRRERLFRRIRRSMSKN